MSVLVTGAGSGLGAAIAQVLHARGHQLLLSGRREGPLTQVAAATGSPWRTADLRRPEDVQALARWADQHGPVTAAVLNAGVGWAGPLAQMPAEAVSDVIGVDLLAPVQLCRLLLPGMLERRAGHLLLVGSVAGSVGVAQEAVYSAAKAGLARFADSLRWELDGTGVLVSLLVPGVVDTAFFDHRGRAYDRAVPRPLAPGRVAATAADLLERPRPEVFAPRWLRFPARLRGFAPALFDELARRLG